MIGFCNTFAEMYRGIAEERKAGKYSQDVVIEWMENDRLPMAMRYVVPDVVNAVYWGELKSVDSEDIGPQVFSSCIRFITGAQKEI